ncbi:thiamine diphosphokinase [Falsirhodobacter algicola]|uniref:Thiamine diphosphokinase n=1 Tax=Falsirhodobacter algicola TaxID=2692330 RepID=A0A8J8MR57_9RHOB|nr:thiamine diphosphokinase [Falsirhodobacter algicola]QUS34942.1 thiamine diphosphokinase [Falsirhodobacter algicola]
MTKPIVQSSVPVTLVAGGPATRRDLRLCLRRAPHLVAADGGADRALAAGLCPDAVIGDLDSISDGARQALAGRLHHVTEQESTDFDKALRNIDAPFVLAAGVTGARADHGLAVLNALVRHRGPPCLLIGPEDVILHAHRPLRLGLRVGDRVSLFPMARLAGRAKGLVWPIEGITFAPDGRIGTSNAAGAAEVTLDFEGPGMLVMLPRARLDAAIRAIR